MIGNQEKRSISLNIAIRKAFSIFWIIARMINFASLNCIRKESFSFFSARVVHIAKSIEQQSISSLFLSLRRKKPRKPVTLAMNQTDKHTDKHYRTVANTMHTEQIETLSSVE